MIVLAPSRGRAQQAAEMVASFRETATLPDSLIRVVIDEDDPCRWDYAPLPTLTLLKRDTGNLVKATNSAVMHSYRPPSIIGHVGDDHRFRTPGWDRLITEALTEPGIAYGDDGLQGANLPTAVFISSVIPRTLGWYALPGSSHLYIDNVWKDLGEALGRLHYLPDVKIEHMHPSVGKSDWDEGYQRSSEPDRIAADHAAYLAWQANDKDRHVALLRAAIG